MEDPSLLPGQTKQHHRKRNTMRIHVRFIIVVSFIVFIFCFLHQYVLCYRCEEPKVESTPVTITKAPWVRRVTKSLAELPKAPELSDHILMFNRIPKSGGEILVFLLQALQGGNNFRHIRLPGIPETMNRQQQKKYTNDVLDIIREKAIPLSFDKTVYFTNFTEFGIQSPIHINLIREPYDNIVSRMSTLSTKDPITTRQTKLINTVTEKFIECQMSGRGRCTLFDGTPYDFTIPYFCGHSTDCLKANDNWALNRAKDVIDRYYPVVGVLEHLNETMTVLEKKIPLFFKGAKEQYSKKLAEPQKFWKRRAIIKKIVEERLKSVLSSEYEFYNWIKARLLSQVSSYMVNT